MSGAAVTMSPELADEIQQLENLTGEKPEKIQKTLATMAKGLRLKVSETAKARFQKVSQKVRG